MQLDFWSLPQMEWPLDTDPECCLERAFRLSDALSELLREGIQVLHFCLPGFLCLLELTENEDEINHWSTKEWPQEQVPQELVHWPTDHYYRVSKSFWLTLPHIPHLHWMTDKKARNFCGIQNAPKEKNFNQVWSPAYFLPTLLWVGICGNLKAS